MLANIWHCPIRKGVKYMELDLPSLLRGYGVLTTFNNIISWCSILLGEETGVSRENHKPATSHWQTLPHNVVSSTSCLSGIRTHNVSGDGHWLQVVVNSTTIHSRPRRLAPDSKRMSLISCIPHINTVPNIEGCLQTSIQGRGFYRSVNYIYIIRDYTYPQSHLSLLCIFRCRYVGKKEGEEVRRSNFN